MVRKTEILKSPVITEKSLKDAKEFGIYTFIVDKQATKSEIAQAVTDQFKVNVVRVRTLNLPPKPKRAGRKRLITYQPGYKKACVQLTPGEKIDLFEEGK